MPDFARYPFVLDIEFLNIDWTGRPVPNSETSVKVPLIRLEASDETRFLLELAFGQSIATGRGGEAYLMKRIGSWVVIWIGFLVVPGLTADQLEVTAGVAGAASGLCAFSCQDAPNFLLPTDIGLYIPGKKTASQELLVLLVPDDTTNLFTSDPIASVKVYNTNPSLTATGVVGTSAFATAANAGATFGLGSGSQGFVTDGFWGTVTSDKAKVKVGKLLGVGLSNSINMANVSDDSHFFSGSDSNEFGIYTLLISAVFGKGQLLDLEMSSPLPEGTVVAAVTNTGLANPIASAGVIDTQSPEPMSIVLLATITIGLGVRSRFQSRA